MLTTGLALAALFLAAGAPVVSQALPKDIDLTASGLLGALVFLVGLFIRVMLKDRGAGYVLADERQEDIAALKADHAADMAAARADLAAVRDQAELLRQEISEQRTLKHQAINDLTIARITLDTVRRLADACTCDALEPVKHLLDRRDPA